MNTKNLQSGKTHKTEFPSVTGEKLAASLELPSGEPKAYALFAHCFSCSKDIKAAREIARALRAQGFAVLRFDFTGLGGSEGDFANTNFSSNVDDLVQAADFLRSEFKAPDILIGHSLGGAASIVAASRIPELKGVATIGAPAQANHVVQHIGDKREEIIRKGEANVDLAGRPFTIKKQFLDDLDGQNVVNAAHALSQPLLILHAPFDQTVGIENASALFVAARHPKSFVSLDSADHLLSSQSDAQYVAKVITAWADRYVDEAHTQSIQVQKERSSKTSEMTKALTVQAPASGSAAQLMTGHAFATAISFDGHQYIIDAGKDDGGEGLGPNPTRVVEGALAACGVMTMKMYARRKGWDLQDAVISVTRAKGEDAHAARIIEKTYNMTGNLDDDQKERLMQMADKCPVHKMLVSEVVIRKKQ